MKRPALLDRDETRLADVPDLHRLWFSEFGSPIELVARACGFLAGTVGLWLYNGMVIGLVWLVAYGVFLGLAYVALRTDRPEEPWPKLVGFGAYFTTAIIFIMLPLWLVSTDDFALNFCGMMALVALGVFTLLREEPPRAVQPFDIAIGAMAIGVATVMQLDRVPSLPARAVIVILAVIVVVYYTMAIIQTRSARANLRVAAKRGYEAQKLEAIGRLSGGIAHDFNNILTVVQGNLELYHHAGSRKERDGFVAEAQVAGQRASSLVSQLLAFARRADLDAEILEAGAVMDEIVTLAARVLPETIRLNTQPPAGVLYLRADRGQLSSALLNLILNARDAMDGRGEITLSVTFQNGAANAPDAPDAPDAPYARADGDGRPKASRGHVQLVVSDTGPGMDAETAARALEPFFSTKPMGEGSGLGLPMAKGFTEQSGGRLSVRTGPEGTHVSLHLPLVDPVDALASTPTMT